MSPSDPVAWLARQLVTTDDLVSLREGLGTGQPDALDRHLWRRVVAAWASAKPAVPGSSPLADTELRAVGAYRVSLMTWAAELVGWDPFEPPDLLEGVLHGAEPGALGQLVAALQGWRRHPYGSVAHADFHRYRADWLLRAVGGRPLHALVDDPAYQALDALICTPLVHPFDGALEVGRSALAYEGARLSSRAVRILRDVRFLEAVRLAEGIWPQGPVLSDEALAALGYDPEREPEPDWD